MKNATIEIVAGHSEQNEPVFVCVGREYRIFFCVSTDSYAKKQKKLKIGHVNGILLTKEHASMRCGNKIGYLTRSKPHDFDKRGQKKKVHCGVQTTSRVIETAKSPKKKATVLF